MLVNWFYKDKDVLDIPPNTIGFIYEITFIDGSKYVGKKNFYSYRKGKKVESNWKKYTGSCNECVGREPIRREIIEFARDKKHLTYLETKLLFFLDVLSSNEYLNTNIEGKYFTRDWEKWYE